MSRHALKNTAAPRIPQAPRTATARRAPGPKDEIPEYGGDMSQLAPAAEGTGKSGEVVTSHLGSRPADVVSSAVDEAELAEAPRPKVWRVTSPDKRISMNGTMFLLREGKEIDENNYDIGALRKQGIKLVEVHPEA